MFNLNNLIRDTFTFFMMSFVIVNVFVAHGLNFLNKKLLLWDGNILNYVLMVFFAVWIILLFLRYKAKKIIKKHSRVIAKKHYAMIKKEINVLEPKMIAEKLINPTIMVEKIIEFRIYDSQIKLFGFNYYIHNSMIARELLEFKINTYIKLQGFDNYNNYQIAVYFKYY